MLSQTCSDWHFFVRRNHYSELKLAPFAKVRTPTIRLDQAQSYTSIRQLAPTSEYSQDYVSADILFTSRAATRPTPVTDSAVPDPTEASLAALDRTIAHLEIAKSRAEQALARDTDLLARYVGPGCDQDELVSLWPTDAVFVCSDEILMADATTLNEALHARLETKRSQAGDHSPELLLT